jgi:hypothetical protein
MDMWRRQNGESSTDKFLDLIADPFQAEVSEIVEIISGRMLTSQRSSKTPYMLP